MGTRRCRPGGHGYRACAPLFLALLAVAVHFWPQAAVALEYDRALIAAGQAWRLVTCHWTHWSADHLILDAVVLAMVGAVYRLRGGRSLGVCIVAAALVIPAAVWVVIPEMARYRGLSGIDAAVTVLLAVTLLRASLAAGRRGDTISALLAIGGLLAKVAFELYSGQAAFVDSVADGFVPVPLAHLLGGLTGAVVALVPAPAELRRGLAWLVPVRAMP